MNETIEWKDVSEEMPDDSEIVLIYSPDSSEPVWLGYWSDEEDNWCYDHAGRVTTEVTHWAYLPQGLGE